MTNSPTRMVSASQLYNFMKCEHRVWRDVYGPQEEKNRETNPFVQLLWDKGILHESRVVQQLGEYADLSQGTLEDRCGRTLSAMRDKTPLIYQGVLMNNSLLGIPDILQYMEDGTYAPVEIKSGVGLEGADEAYEDIGKPKKTYAVQLALYVELLESYGFSKNRRGFVIDINESTVEYDLNQQIGVRDIRSYWDLYMEIKTAVVSLINDEVRNTPAASGVCKLCSWYDSCMRWIRETDDLTGLFYVGRSKRDVIVSDIGVSGIQGALDIDIDQVMATKKNDKSFLSGIGKKTLEQIRARANVIKTIKAPVIYNKVEFPNVTHELFFDIEDDPTQDFVYLHGVYERSAKGCKFNSFTAKDVSPEAEQEAWAEFWRYIQGMPSNNFAVYYYSSHEKSTYRRLQRQYPDIITIEELESFFDHPNVIDLYNIVLKNTDWPLGSYSLKSLAMFLGFEWRDDSPSGALSIQWFNDYVATGEPKILERILLYNEDDCRATMCLKDKLKELSDSLG